MARRRRSLFRAPRLSWPARLIVLALIAIAGYFGKGRWGDIGLPGLDERAAESHNSAPISSSPTPSTSTPPRSYSDEQVVVERVVDGDTLVISGGDRIRLIGVDTPETHHP